MNILIVDDEQPARDRLRQLIDDSAEHTVVGEASDGTQAVQAAAELKPDVVLLDIRMPGLGGIEAAHHMNKLPQPPAVVFTTAYDEYAIEAFDANAIGYVLKPVRQERLTKALLQAARVSTQAIEQFNDNTQSKEQRSHVCARVQDSLHLIPVAEVCRFQADQKYVRVFHDEGEYLIDDSLKMLEREFADKFVRIHRGALVAIGYIDSLRKLSDGQTCVVLRGTTSEADGLIISRRHLADVKRRLKGA